MSPPLKHIDTSPKPPASADVVVIGAGIIGVGFEASACPPL